MQLGCDALKAAMNEPILIGASWYPEMWDATEWPKDAQRMQELGFRIVRLFEFAWKRMEPSEGCFDFDWALEVLDICHAHGIKVMIGTPTAAPPAWLTETYPEVLQVDLEGRPAKHGQRKHFNHHSKVYRQFCTRIVEAMAKAFASHPAVYAWQIDNEMSGSDYSQETHRLFHDWLEQKYGSIAALNEAWGLQFWSQAYDSFAQIPLVDSRIGTIEVPERHHPSLLMALATFQNAGWTSFIQAQCEVIRQYSEAPITSNMTESPGMHWYQHNKHLDAVGASVYKDMAHYHWTYYIFDRMRAEKERPYWLLETAPSWSAGGRIWNIHMHSAGLRTISWLSLIMGGSMILYWQWRQHWAGQEMLHGTLVTATGQWRPGVEAHKALCQEVKTHETWLQDHPAAKAEVAVLYSNESAWSISIDPYDDGVVYTKRWRDDFYLPLAESHIWRDVVDETADWSAYKVLIIPMLPMLRQETLHKLEQWVAAGGHLWIGPLVGNRTPENTLWKDRAFGGLEQLMGAESKYGYPPKWMEQRSSVEGEGLPSSQPAIWCEAYAPTSATVLAWHKGGYGDGQPAIIRNAFGKGSVTSCGTFVSRDLYLAQIQQLLDTASIAPVVKGSHRVIAVPRVNRRSGKRSLGLLNMDESIQAIEVPEGIDRISGQRMAGRVELQPLQVVLLEC